MKTNPRLILTLIFTAAAGLCFLPELPAPQPAAEPSATEEQETAPGQRAGAPRHPATAGTVPERAWPSIHEQIAAEQRTFRKAPDGMLHSYNPSGGERLLLAPDGTAEVRLRGDATAPETAAAADPMALSAVATTAEERPDVRLKLRTAALGRPGSTPELTAISPPSAVDRHRSEHRLTVPGGNAVMEWWRSGERGFEVGWTVAERPPGEGPLQLAVEADCPWPVTASDAGTRLVWQDPAGSGWQLVCEGLVVWDASGRELPARMTAADGRLVVSVDDAGAAYPVTVDPWFFGDRGIFVRAGDAASGQRFGALIDTCGDLLVASAAVPGSTEPYDGNVYIMVRQGGNYGTARKIPNTPRPSENAVRGTLPFSVSGDVVAVGPLPGVSGFKAIVCERNAGGPMAFGTVAEIPLGADPALCTIKLSGDLLMVGVPRSAVGEMGGAGVVRIHRRDAGGPSAWGQVAALDAGDLIMPTGYFGLAAGFSGRTLTVVGLTGATILTCFVFEAASDEGTAWVRRKVFTLPGSALEVPVVRLMGDTLAVGIRSSGVRIFERDAGGPDQWGLAKQISAPGGENSFGFSLALQGGLLAVGAPDEDVDHDDMPATPAITDAGMVRVYSRDSGGVNGWGLVQTFSPGAGAEAKGRFGEGLAFGEGRLFIGRPRDDLSLPTVTDAGVVAGYTLLSGSWRGTTLAAHSQNATGYGQAVAVSGPYVLIGAPLSDGPAGVDAGWAYLFRDEVLVKALLPGSQQAGEQFGRAVAIDGNRLVVGSPGRSGMINAFSYSDLGAVTIFERNQGGADNWGQVKTFSQPSVSNTSASPEFGTSVALEGDVLVVGAPQETALALPGASVRGRAKVFYRNTGGADNWGQVRSFQGMDNGTEEVFGTSVALRGDTLIVGAPWEAVDGVIRSGAAYLHRRNEGGPDNWGRTARLTQPEVKGDSWFGYSVALDGDDAVIGAPHEDRFVEPNVGAVYFFGNGRPLQDEWTFTRRWQADDWETEYQGGTSVAVSHGLALVGVPRLPFETAGTVYLLGRDAGGPDQWGTVWSSSGQESYGTSVAMDGTALAVGEPLAEVTVNNITQTDRGRVLAYHMEAGEFAAVARRGGGAMASRLGSSAALHREWLVVGAPDEDAGAEADAGAAYVFHRDRPAPGAWGMVQRLANGANNAAGARFGAALALDAQWLMVGVPGSHQVRTFYRQDQNTPQQLIWVDSVSLTAGGQPNALGTSLAMDDGFLLAGAPQQTVSGLAGAGAVYRFERNMAGENSWALQGSMSAADPGTGDAFGSSIAMSGTRVAVGSPLDDNGEGTNAGAVYLFERNHGGVNDWGQQLKLTHSSQTAGDELGRSVALRDDLLLAGLPGADPGGQADAGSALLFSRNEGGANTWGRLKTLTAPDGTPQARFGSAVAVDAHHAIAGAPFADPRGRANAGAVYVFSREWTGNEAWAPLQILAPTDLSAGAEFGAALALDRTTLLTGAPGDLGSGRAYLHTFRARAFYDDWAAAHGLEGDWALPQADADGDGQPNLIEMVLGSHPRHGHDLGKITLAPSGGQLILTAHKDKACTVPVLFTAETSTNLQAWTAAGPGLILADNATELKIQLPLTPAPRTFARWRATLP